MLQRELTNEIIVEACQHTSAINSPLPFSLWKKKNQVVSRTA